MAKSSPRWRALTASAIWQATVIAVIGVVVGIPLGVVRARVVDPFAHDTYPVPAPMVPVRRDTRPCVRVDHAVGLCPRALAWLSGPGPRSRGARSGRRLRLGGHGGEIDDKLACPALTLPLGAGKDPVRKGLRLGFLSSRWWDSNPRPDDYKSPALPLRHTGLVASFAP